MSSLSQRLVSLDSLKFVSIIGVFFAHSDFPRFSDRTAYLVHIGQHLLGWCVLGFFFCAGVVYRRPGADGLWHYVSKRFQRLILPCIAFSVLYRALLVLASYCGFTEADVTLPQNALSILEFVLWPVGPQFYFLWYLFGACLILATLDVRGVDLRSLLVALYVAVVVLVLLEKHPIRPYGPDIRLLPSYFAAMILGALVARNLLQPWLLTVLLVTAAIAWLASGTELPLLILVPLAVCRLFDRFPWANYPEERLKIGRRSGQLFVWHAPILMPLCSMLAVRVSNNPVLQLTVLFTASTLGCLIAGAVANALPVARPWRM